MGPMLTHLLSRSGSYMKAALSQGTISVPFVSPRFPMGLRPKASVALGAAGPSFPLGPRPKASVSLGAVAARAFNLSRLCAWGSHPQTFPRETTRAKSFITLSVTLSNCDLFPILQIAFVGAVSFILDSIPSWLLLPTTHWVSSETQGKKEKTKIFTLPAVAAFLARLTNAPHFNCR